MTGKDLTHTVSIQTSLVILSIFFYYLCMFTPDKCRKLKFKIVIKIVHLFYLVGKDLMQYYVLCVSAPLKQL